MTTLNARARRHGYGLRRTPVEALGQTWDGWEIEGITPLAASARSAACGLARARRKKSRKRPPMTTIDEADETTTRKEETMHYIVNFSAGLTSWKALQRTIERHGSANTTTVFADTKIEDADSYRFLRDTEQYFGIEIHTVADGRTPFEVWRDTKTITINGIAPCSKILKREVVDAWVAARFGDTPITRVFGMDWSEADRMIRLQVSLAPTPVWFPLNEAPYVDKCQIADELERIGIAVPALYGEGFTHNNCGGGCVRAGQAHWAHLWRTRPGTYARWEQEESNFIASYGKKITILKDRRGAGPRRPITLTEFRQRLERGEAYDADEWGGCGCFAPVSQMRMDELLLTAEPRR